MCSSQRAAVLGKEKKKRGVECEDGACGTSLEAGPAHAAGGDEDTEHTGTDVGRTTRSQRTGWNARFLFEPTKCGDHDEVPRAWIHTHFFAKPSSRPRGARKDGSKERERERESCCHQRR